MKKPLNHLITVLSASFFVFATPGLAATALSHTPIFPYDPDTYFADGVTAGLDFNNDGAGSPTQSGFLGVPGSNNKTYNLTHNGITFDIKVINANQDNQNRDRGATSGSGQTGDLTRDFEQWYGIDAPGGAVEAHIQITGLLPNSIYDLDFFTMNIGAGSTRHFFYDGTSSADDLIVDFATVGAPNTEANRALWTPGVTIQYQTDGSGKIDVTIQATVSGATNASRITFNGMSVNYIEPAATNTFQLVITPNEAPGLYDFEWESKPGKIYDLLTSLDLATPIAEWPVYDDGEVLHEGIPATGTTTTLMGVPSSDPRRFFALIEEDGPPLFFADFEGNDGGFTVVGAPNDWAWGAPNSDNDAGLILTTGNDSSTNVWATNLGTGGTPSGVINTAANSILRSPEIKLTGITGAQLSFAAAYDLANGDIIEVLIRDATTNDLIGTPIIPLAGPFPAESNWTTLGPFDLSAADDRDIHLEFRYQGSDANFIGLYIDDVTVTQ